MAQTQKHTGRSMRKQKTQTCVLMTTGLWYLTKGKKHTLEKRYHLNSVGTTGCPHVRRMKLDLYVLPCTKFNSMLIKDFHLKLAMLKLLEEKIIGPWMIGKGKEFLNKIPFAWELRSIIAKWDMRELKIPSAQQKKQSRVKRKHTKNSKNKKIKKINDLILKMPHRS